MEGPLYGGVSSVPPDSTWHFDFRRHLTQSVTRDLSYEVTQVVDSDEPHRVFWARNQLFTFYTTIYNFVYK